MPHPLCRARVLTLPSFCRSSPRDGRSLHHVLARSAKTFLLPLLVETDRIPQILDDTLAFAKITNADPAPAPASRDLLEVELEQLAEDVLKSCWARKHQRSALEESKKEGENDQVDLVLEMDRRLDGCRAKVDVGGLKRCESLRACEEIEVLTSLVAVLFNVRSLVLCDTGLR